MEVAQRGFLGGSDVLAELRDLSAKCIGVQGVYQTAIANSLKSLFGTVSDFLADRPVASTEADAIVGHMGPVVVEALDQMVASDLIPEAALSTIAKLAVVEVEVTDGSV